MKRKMLIPSSLAMHIRDRSNEVDSASRMNRF
jgi:hypothetical protein